MTPKLKQNISATILFVFFLSLYTYTAAPGVYDGDSGEITVTVNELGLAHPTGFPLYMLLGKLFTLLVPLKDVAYRLNILSATLTTLAIIFVFYSLKNLGNSSFSSLIASFALGLGRNTIWSNAGTARIYSMSLLFASILLFLFSRWNKEHQVKYLYWYSFIWGLSLGTHILMVIMFIPFGFMLWQERLIISKKLSILFKATSLAILPLLQYLYLPFAYARQGFITWGDIGNFDGFVYYITQKQYAEKVFANPISDLGNFLAKITILITTEFTVIFFCIGLVGLFALLKKNRGLASILILIAISNAGMMYSYGRSGDLFILFRYIFFIDLILSLTIAYGIDLLINKLGILKNNKKAVIFTIIIISIILLQFKGSYAHNNRKDVYIFEDFAHNALMSVEPNSILLAADDNIINPLWYLQSMGGYDDIIILSAGLLNYEWYVRNQISKHPDILDVGLLSEKWDSNRVAHIINKNIVNKNLYTTFTSWDEYSDSNFDFIPVGNIYRVVLRRNNGTEKILQRNEVLWENYFLRGIKADTHKDAAINQLVKRYALSLNNVGVAYAKIGRPQEAINFLEKSLNIIPDSKVKENLQEVKRILGQ